MYESGLEEDARTGERLVGSHHTESRKKFESEITLGDTN